MAAVEDQQRGGESAEDEIRESAESAESITLQGAWLVLKPAELSAMATLPGTAGSVDCWTTQQSGCPIDTGEPQLCVASWQQAWQPCPTRQAKAGIAVQRTATASNIHPPFLPTFINVRLRVSPAIKNRGTPMDPQ